MRSSLVYLISYFAAGDSLRSDTPGMWYCTGYLGHPFKKSLSDNDDYALPFKHRLCEQMS